jgi:hypothetical protein
MMSDEIAPHLEEALEVSHDRSSSTEGPDSPAHSNSSSPLGDVISMIPAYPQETEEEGDTEARPLLPLFSVKMLEDVSKDGDAVRYKIRVKKLNGAQQDDSNDQGQEPRLIEREYDDFEFLHHVLTTHNQVRCFQPQDLFCLIFSIII